MKCKYCGELLEDGSRFCYRCGKAAEPKPAKRHCGYCGAELEMEAAFCWKCGKVVSSTAQSEVAEKSGETSAVSNVGKPPKPEAEEKIALKARTAALVIAAQSGDSDSFTELYRLYNQKIFALARTTVRSNADAEDVLQMTFLKAWNHLGKLKNPSAFSTWIQRITLNQCYSLLRKKHIDISIDDDDEDTEPIQLESDLMLPEVYAERSDLKERLGRIIRSLSAVQQQTVTLYYFDGLPVENIAWIMDCSVNTVKSRLFLARKSIKTEIEEQERKSGQPFYGIVGLGTIPFGKLFVEQVEANALPQSAVSKVLESITRYIVESVAKNVGQAAAETARSAGEASAKTVANSAAKTTAGVTVKASARTAAKAATAAVSKKVIAGVVAGVLAVGAVTGGTVAAVSAVKKNRAEAAQTQIVQEKTLPAEHWQEPDIFDPEQADLIRAERQAAYRAYLDCLIENKSGIDNYIWQKGYALPLFNENGDSYDAPLTDAYVARPVVLCDICGDEIPELIYMGDVEPGWWEGGYYYNESGAILHIVTYRDGRLVDLFTSNECWDDSDHFFPYSLFQTSGEKALYASSSWGDVSEEDTLTCFREGTDGKLHQTQVCRYYYDGEAEFDIDRDPSIAGEPDHYYGADETEISKEEYQRILHSKCDRMTSVLMYNYGGGGEDVLAAVEQRGCPAMTCDEAIAYLRELLGDDEQQHMDAFRAYRDHLLAERDDIDSYVWQYADWTEWFDVEWDEDTDTGYMLRNDRPINEAMPLSRPVVICDLAGDSTPELLYIRFDDGARLDDDHMSRLVILTWRNGQLVTLFDREWERVNDFEGASGFRIYASASDAYGLLVQWFDGMTEWSLDLRDVFTRDNDGLHRTQLLYHERDYDEDAEQEINTYRQRDTEIDQATYETYAAQWEQACGRLLLYSGSRGHADYAGSISMTCGEAIEYLEKQLGLNHSLATDDRSSDMPYFQTTFTASSGNIGTAAVKLKKGFDFIKSDSSLPNHELAVTAITLSAQVYNNAQGNKAEEILKGLGYDKTAFSNGDSSFAHPGVCFGFKQLESGKNLFTAVVRGTDNLADFWTDVQDGHLGMFRVSGEYIEAQLETFMKKVTGKTKDELLREENYFFFTGHSLGGAVANYLSINGDIMQFAGSDKGKIYTYTFESPHTCVNLWWTDPESESNAFNYKVDGDAVTNYPAYMGSTTYGKDIWIRVSELNDRLFLELFPDSACETLAIATSVDGHGDIYGLHDVCLDLVYVVEEAINNGSSAYKDPNSKEAMYRAYLDVLQKHEDHILRYQQDAWFDADTRPIALRNVYGDEMPELLFLESISGDYDDEVALVIVTYSDGSAQTIFSDTVCYDIIEESFFLYQLPGNDTLYMSTSSGRQYVSIDTYYAFVPSTNGNLEMKVKMYLEAESDPDSGSKTVIFCQIDGKNAKESEFAKEEAYISNYLDCVLQGNLIPRYGYWPESIPSMTYEEATLHLKQLVANGILE